MTVRSWAFTSSTPTSQNPWATAGPLALVRDQYGASVEADESLLVMNGDLLTELDIPALVEFHRRTTTTSPSSPDSSNSGIPTA